MVPVVNGVSGSVPVVVGVVSGSQPEVVRDSVVESGSQPVVKEGKNGGTQVAERGKVEKSAGEHQRVEDGRGGGARKRRKARWRMSRIQSRTATWADWSRAVRRWLGLPAREGVCGFEEVDRPCLFASCYDASACCSRNSMWVAAVVFVREIISLELVRGPYI